MSTPPLAPDALAAFLAAHPHWRHADGALTRTFEAPSFLDGIAFVSKVARLAEAADHHPDIDIRWRKVTLRLSTHDAGNVVTQKDTRLAAEADLVFATG